MITTYQLVNAITIPYKVCYDSGRQYCIPCTNWKSINYNNRDTCNYKQSTFYPLDSDVDFDKVKSDILATDVISDNGVFFCNTDNKNKCTSNGPFDIKHRTVSVSAYKPDALLSSSDSTITVQLNDTVQPLNTAQNMFTGYCSGNTGANTITAKTVLENRFGIDERLHKNFNIPTPTHISYNNSYLCNSLPITQLSSNTAHFKTDNSIVDFNTNGIIYNIKSNDSDIVVDYLTSDNLVSTDGSVITIPIESSYTLVTHDSNGNQITKTYNNTIGVGSNVYDFYDINTTMIHYSSNWANLEGSNALSLECPADSYISGYSVNKDNKNIIIRPYCVKVASTSASTSASTTASTTASTADNTSTSASSADNTTLTWIIIATVAIIIVILLIVALKSGRKEPDLLQLAALLN